jgi:hypothetical protein
MKAPAPMAGVFISYRREDSPGHAGRVFDRVRARFGAAVFMDVTAIDAGADFVDAIEQAVGTCDVLLAIIGPQWVGAADGAGGRRLEHPNDFIRLEIASALKRNVRVVPVLVDGARLPTAGDLPDDLQPLLRRNAVELRDARWDADIEQLIASLERMVKAGEEPLRLEASARGPVRTFVALAVVAVSVVAAVVFGPRGCAPAPDTTAVAGTPPPAAAPPAVTAPSTAPSTPPTAAPSGAPSITPNATVPDVVGRPLPEAREILRRAGVEVARVLYRDDRTKAVDLVVLQSETRTGAGGPAAVALTAVARAAVVIRHSPEDAELARGLLGFLVSSRSATGLALRTVQTSAVRSENVAKVTYRDADLAATAADIARDANAWLRRSDSGRPQLTTAVYPPVVPRTIVIGLPEPSGTASSSSAAPLPDVRGLSLGAARRSLAAAGVNALDYKWSDDGSRKPFEVFGQSEVTGRASGRMVVLQVGAKGTLWVYHVVSDAPVAERFARDLQANLNVYGILVRLSRVSTVRPTMVGKVASADAALAREARTIATFASNWLGKEHGRSVRIEAVTDAVGPQRFTFGFPPPR